MADACGSATLFVNKPPSPTEPLSRPRSFSDGRAAAGRKNADTASSAAADWWQEDESIGLLLRLGLRGGSAPTAWMGVHEGFRG